MDSSPAPEAPPVFANLEGAAARIAPHAVRTPLIESAALNERLGGRLLLKPETLQRTGSFKFRGACNFISRLDPAKPGGGVAYSSGNHAQGVAAAARLFGHKAAIIMPADAPAIKRANTEVLGAQVVAYDRDTETRETIAAAIAAERGAALVPPYDHPWTIAGQGTVGLELAAQATEAAATLDAVLCCCGGGGLIAGIALALERLSPATHVYAVEPAGFDDTARSLEAGKRVANAPGARSICDALLGPTPGEITFPINRRLLDGGLVVDDAAAERAMAFAFTTLKLVVEPGGAVALAAALSSGFDCRGKTVAVVLTGGNVDRETFCRALARQNG